MLNSLYTYKLNIYVFVWFYGISTIAGYLMPNPVYAYILNVYMICIHILFLILLNEHILQPQSTRFT